VFCLSFSVEPLVVSKNTCDFAVFDNGGGGCGAVEELDTLFVGLFSHPCAKAAEREEKCPFVAELPGDKGDREFPLALQKPEPLF